MLCTAYKVYAKMLANRLSSHLKFVKGRFIPDAIIALWVGVEYAQETEQDFLFFQIYFEKAYDRLEWDSLLQSPGRYGSK